MRRSTSRVSTARVIAARQIGSRGVGSPVALHQPQDRRMGQQSESISHFRSATPGRISVRSALAQLSEVEAFGSRMKALA